MGKVRQMKRTRAKAPRPPKDGALPPHTVTSVVIRFEVEFKDKDGRVTGRQLTDPIPVYEAQFFPGLTDFIKSKGLTINEKKEAADGKDQK